MPPVNRLRSTRANSLLAADFADNELKIKRYDGTVIKVPVPEEGVTPVNDQDTIDINFANTYFDLGAPLTINSGTQTALDSSSTFAVGEDNEDLFTLGVGGTFQVERTFLCVMKVFMGITAAPASGYFRLMLTGMFPSLIIPVDWFAGPGVTLNYEALVMMSPMSDPSMFDVVNKTPTNTEFQSTTISLIPVLRFREAVGGGGGD